MGELPAVWLHSVWAFRNQYGLSEMNWNRLPAVILFGLCASLPAAASVIYTTGGSPPTFSTNPANACQINIASNAFSAVAEFFVPLETMDLGEIDLPLAYVAGTNAVTVSIQSGAGVPTTILESFTLAAPLTASLVNITSVTHPQLVAGTKYWVVVSITGDASVRWFVDPFSPRGVSLQQEGVNTWFESSGSTKGSVQLLSAVPEPSTAVLLGLGAALLLIAGVRRKRF